MRLILLLFGAAGLVAAQTALTGAIHGRVTDASGAALEGVAILLNTQGQQTGADGAFTFVRVAPGAYSISASRDGFQTWRRSGVEVLSGETLTLSVVLPIAARTDTLEVTATAPGLARDSAELSTTVSREALDALPANGRNVTRFALLDSRVRNSNALSGDGSNLHRLAINGNIFRDTQHRLDGNSNYDSLFNNIPLQRVPMLAVGEFRVLTNQFNAEHGSTSAGLTITTTKSGSEQFHGELFALIRPSGIQARPPLASLRVPNQLAQEGASFSGPLAKRTFFFAAYERTDQRRGSFLNGGGFYTGQYADNLAMAKLDHATSDSHWLSLRLNGHRDRNTNANDRVGGLTQPSAATLAVTQATAAQATSTKTWGGVVNELRLGYTNAVPSSSLPQTPQTGFTRPGVFTQGAFTYSNNRTEVYQLADQVAGRAGAHTFKAGADFIRRKVRDRQFDAFGSYTLNAAGDPILYTQRFGAANLRYGQTQWAGFVQDAWQVRRDLLLSLGVRYDYQSLLDDFNNLAPRVAFVWNPRQGGTVIRGGFALHYDQPFFHGLTQRFLLNAVGAPFASYSLAPSHPAFPQFPGSFAPLAPPAGLALAPRNLVVRGDKLLAPYTTQFTLGVQRELAGGWVLSVDGTRSLTVKQFLHYDRNAATPFARMAPGQTRSVAEADRTRPMASFEGVAIRELRQTVNGNTANYHALTVNLNRRFAGRYLAGLSYNWASAMNSVTDDHLGANPQEWSDVQRGERGPSDYLQRQRLAFHGSARLRWGWQLSALATAASGLPVNAITGVDNNGDGLLRDRPVGVSRNAFRGTPQRNLDVSVAKTFAVTEGLRLETRADAYNVFSNQNYYTFNNVYGNGAAAQASFLRPIGGVANVDPARQFTFSVKLSF